MRFLTVLLPIFFVLFGGAFAIDWDRVVSDVGNFAHETLAQVGHVYTTKGAQVLMDALEDYYKQQCVRKGVESQSTRCKSVHY
jgi:hypothetical protein